MKKMTNDKRVALLLLIITVLLYIVGIIIETYKR